MNETFLHVRRAMNRRSLAFLTNCIENSEGPSWGFACKSFSPIFLYFHNFPSQKESFAFFTHYEFSLTVPWCKQNVKRVPASVVNRQSLHESLSDEFTNARLAIESASFKQSRSNLYSRCVALLQFSMFKLLETNKGFFVILDASNHFN